MGHAVIAPPGSDEARKFGCACAVIENNFGRWPPQPAMYGEPASWWISGACPVHGRSATPGADGWHPARAERP